MPFDALLDLEKALRHEISDGIHLRASPTRLAGTKPDMVCNPFYIPSVGLCTLGRVSV